MLSTDATNFLALVRKFSFLSLPLLLLLPLNGLALANDAYRLGKGDEVKITVFGEEDLSGTFVVDGKGSISMPLIGEVIVGDLDLREVEGQIVNKLKEGYLKQPKISLEVLNFRPFYILGEVKEPGSYPYVDGMSILEAIAVAGGFTYRAKKESIEVKRGPEGAKTEDDFPVDAPVQPGDVIRVKERFF